jgi:hypothetical protein
MNVSYRLRFVMIKESIRLRLINSNRLRKLLQKIAIYPNSQLDKLK